MSNMSYVRFENTYYDLQDCYYAMEDKNDLSKSELKYRLLIIKLAIDIAGDYEHELEE